MVQPPLPAYHGARDAGPIPAAAGIGLRLAHHRRVLDDAAAAAWLEVHPENYMSGGGAAAELDAIRRDHALSLHAVGLSLGSADGVRSEHLDRLRGLIERTAPGLVSDHLSWSSIGDIHLPDLLPLPYTEEALAVVSRNVARAQEALQRPLLLENPSTYLRLPGAALSEPEFLGEVARRTGCGVLLDINNIYVSACNHGTDPLAELASWLTAVPAAAIGEMHLAGHATQALDDGRTLRIDDHGAPVCAEVWRMYEIALDSIGPCPTLIEWDTDLPSLETLQAEAAKAQDRMEAMARRQGARHARAG